MAIRTIRATARAFRAIADSVDAASKAMQDAESWAKRVMDAHSKLRQRVEESMPEIAGYLDALERSIDILNDPNASPFAKIKAQENLNPAGAFVRILEMFDKDDVFNISEYANSYRGTNVPKADPTRTGSPPKPQSSTHRASFPFPPTPPSMQVAPAPTPPRTPPTTTKPNRSTGRSKP